MSETRCQKKFNKKLGLDENQCYFFHLSKFRNDLSITVRYSFLQKLCQKWGKEASSRSFYFLKMLYMR